MPLVQPYAAGNATGSRTPLFRGAFMESGAQAPVGSILNGQNYCEYTLFLLLLSLN